MNQPPQTPEAAARHLRVVTISLATGVLAFAAFTLVARDGQAEHDALLLTYLAPALAAALVAGRFVVPGAMRGALVRRIANRESDAGDIEKSLPGHWQVTNIVARAMLEGAALVNLMAFHLEHQWLNLAVAGGCLVGLLLPFPTLMAFEAWRERLLRAVEERRMLGRFDR